MKLNERQEDILDFVVRDFVRTACPVSSLRISKKKNLGLSTASIRNIMFELDEEGFLHQGHTSAGRAPTKKGYLYFVNNLMQERAISESVKSDFDKIFSEFFGDNMFDELTSLVANRLNLFSGIVTKGRVFKHGLSRVLREPEFAERDLAIEFTEFTDGIEDKISQDGIVVGEFGVVGYNFGIDSFVFSVGPKRMDYEKTSAILRYLTKLL